MSIKLQTPRLIFSLEWYRQRWGLYQVRLLNFHIQTHEARVLKECLEATQLPIIRFVMLPPIPTGGGRLGSCARVSPESLPVWAAHKHRQKVKKRERCRTDRCHLLRSPPGPPSTVNSCLIWTLATHHMGCNYSLWNGLADITVHCVLLCLPQSASDLRSRSISASQPNCPVTMVWKGRRVAPLPTSVGVGGRGGEDAALLKSWKSWEFTPHQLEQSAHDQALVYQGVQWSGSWLVLGWTCGLSQTNEI